MKGLVESQDEFLKKAFFLKGVMLFFFCHETPQLVLLLDSSLKARIQNKISVCSAFHEYMNIFRCSSVLEPPALVVVSGP